MKKAHERIAVIGGGVSGLACGLCLADAGADVQVYEAGAQAGGWVGTETVDGHQCERGPAALRGPAGEEALLERLGLTSDVLLASPAARSRFIVHDGHPVAAPAGPGALLGSPLLPFAGVVRALAEPLIPRRRSGPEESVEAFFRRRFGRGVARLADPLVSGIFAGDAARLSIGSAFPALAGWERDAGSVLRGAFGGRGPRRSLYTFREGLAELPRRLARCLGERLRTETGIERLERDGSSWRLDGEPFAAVVLAVPAHVAAGLLGSLDSEWVRLLQSIPFVDVAVASISWPAESFETSPSGFGVLVPRGEGYRILGCIYESSLFPHRAPEGRVLVRTLAGGRMDPDVVGLSDEALGALLREETERLLGARASGTLLQLRRCRNAIPQYELGHAALLTGIESRRKAHPGVYLTGSSYRGISVPDCIRDGIAVAESVLKDRPA